MVCGKGHKIVLTRELEVSAILKGDARTVHPLQGGGGGGGGRKMFYPVLSVGHNKFRIFPFLSATLPMINYRSLRNCLNHKRLLLFTTN